MFNFFTLKSLKNYFNPIGYIWMIAILHYFISIHNFFLFLCLYVLRSSFSLIWVVLRRKQVTSHNPEHQSERSNIWIWMLIYTRCQRTDENTKTTKKKHAGPVGGDIVRNWSCWKCALWRTFVTNLCSSFKTLMVWGWAAQTLLLLNICIRVWACSSDTEEHFESEDNFSGVFKKRTRAASFTLLPITVLHYHPCWAEVS